jgi:hypothetical protein
MRNQAPIDKLLAAFGHAVKSSTFVKLDLRKPTAQAGDMKSVDLRLIMVKRELKLSFTYHHQTRDIVKNYSVSESASLLAKLVGRKFLFARLYALTGDMHLASQPAGFTLTTSAASHDKLPELDHNRTKSRLIGSAGKPYLHALGLTNIAGHVHKNAQDKFRQINKYVEILDGLVKQLNSREKLRIVDMGAGKGYLTFALHDHLTNRLGLAAEVIGVEQRQDLVTLCNGIAAANDYAGLRFEQGSIAQFDCSGADIVVALHACDTATDDAINKAVRADASLIVVAPCCHRQIRREMEKSNDDGSLAFLTRFGTYVERIAEMVTDGLRAQILELHGYRSNLFEFIGDAHTPKNVMIVAAKLPTPRSSPERDRIAASIAATKQKFGIRTHELERLLK